MVSAGQVSGQAAGQVAGQVRNWAGNVTFGARAFHRPTSVAQLQELVAGSDRVRALGSGHSFNRIADTTGDLVSLADLPPVIAVDAGRRSVTVGAGVRFGDLSAAVQREGLALHTLGSLPHISVAGACATGTHGSGDGSGNLASAVSAVEFVAADGALVTRDREHPDFAGSVIALGALGIVTSLTFDLVPTFDVRQWVYEDVAADDLDRVLSGAYSVSAFTEFTQLPFEQVWLKRRVDEGEPDPDWLGGHRADGRRHMTRGVAADNTTEQGGVPGPWHQRLPHFRPDFRPSSGDELQSEYLVARTDGDAALAALNRIGDRITPALQGSEIRSVAADGLWLSPAYGRDSVALHFTWRPDADAVARAVAPIEEALAPFAARPHWGKVFSTDPETVRGLYERLPDAERLLRGADPTGKFRNALIDRYLPG